MIRRIRVCELVIELGLVWVIVDIEWDVYDTTDSSADRGKREL